MFVSVTDFGVVSDLFVGLNFVDILAEFFVLKICSLTLPFLVDLQPLSATKRSIANCA